MEITLKNLKNEITKLTVNSVQDIKEHVANKDKCNIDQIKCIYQGRVLENNQTMQELNYDGTKYIVYMISNIKTAPKVIPKSEPGSPVKGNSERRQDTPSVDSGTLKGEKLEKAVEEMKSMGFVESDIAKAMKKAFDHPDRAIEYLLSGNLDVGEGPAGTMSPLQPPEEHPELNEQGIGIDADQDTQMEQLLQLMQSNPEVLQQLMQANPQMGEQILQYLQGVQQHEQPQGQQSEQNQQQQGSIY
eukprot:NODE_623_length_5907_cov_0.380165.p1 type:complete len:245 gc:universal NODE_623_length_5907_cov_0.380165:4443-3709(-)